MHVTRAQIKKAICLTTHQKLVGFGYPDLQLKEIEEIYDRAISGEPKRDDIFDMFVYGDIETMEDQIDMKLIPDQQ